MSEERYECMACGLTDRSEIVECPDCYDDICDGCRDDWNRCTDCTRDLDAGDVMPVPGEGGQ